MGSGDGTYAYLNPMRHLICNLNSLCPGRHLGTASVWIAVASILAVFDIAKAVDGEGKEVEPTYEYLSGFLRCVLKVDFSRRDVECLIDFNFEHCSGPLPFKASIKPRSARAADLIRATATTTTGGDTNGIGVGAADA